VITGRKVQDYRNTRTNLFTICVGPSGVGKDLPRKVNTKLLHGTGLHGADKFFSGTGLVTALEKQPAFLSQMDEAGIVLKSICSDQSKTQGNSIAGALMSVFSSSDIIWSPDGFANADRNISIDQPHLVLYGSTTGSVLFDALSSGGTVDGFVGRLMFFLSPSGGYAKYKDGQNLPIPESLTTFIQSWIDRNFGGGNLNSSELNSGSSDPFRIEITKDASARARDQRIGIAEKRMHEDEVTAAIWSRAQEKTSKLALLYAISRESEVIEIQDVDLAIATTNFLTRRLIALIQGNIASTAHEKNVLRLMRTIKDEGVISVSDLGRKARWLPDKDKDSILAQLVRSGELINVIRPTKGREAHGYASNMAAIKRTKWIPITADLIAKTRA